MTVAGHGLLETETLVNAGDGALKLAVQKVSGSILEEWNPSASFTGGITQADALVQKWLSHPITPRGRIPQGIKKNLQITQDFESFKYKGIEYSKPYGFSSPDFPGRQKKKPPA